MKLNETLIIFSVTSFILTIAVRYVLQRLVLTLDYSAELATTMTNGMISIIGLIMVLHYATQLITYK